MKILPAGLLVLVLWSTAAATPPFHAAPEPMLQIDPGTGWGIAVDGHLAKRQLDVAANKMEFDTSGAAFRAGYNIFPFLHPYAVAGWCRAELPGDGSRPDREGKGGFHWGLGTVAHIAQWPLNQSSAAGVKQDLRLLLDVRYDSYKSNFGDHSYTVGQGGNVQIIEEDGIDFSWREWRITPTILYSINRYADAQYPTFATTGIALRGGIVFSDLKADYGDSRLDGRNDFGALVGADFRWTDGWVLEARGVFLDSEERNLSLSFARYF